MARRSLWIRLLLSGGIIAFLLCTIDLHETAAILARSNSLYLVCALAVAFADRVFKAYKWNLLLKAKSISIPLLNVTVTYLTSTFLGILLPATVGADALRAYAISKQGHKASDVISSIIVERVFGTLALLIFVLLGVVLSLLVFGEDFINGLWGATALVLVALAGVVVLVYVSVNRSVWRGLLALLTKWNKNVHKHKLIVKLREVYQSYQQYRDKRVLLGVFLLLSFLETLFPIFWTYFLALSFGIQVPFVYFFILVPVVLVLVRIPISLDGAGIQEGTFVYLLSFMGISSSAAFFLGASSHILAILSVIPGGIAYLLGGIGSARRSKQTVESIVVRDTSR